MAGCFCLPAFGCFEATTPHHHVGDDDDDDDDLNPRPHAPSEWQTSVCHARLRLSGVLHQFVAFLEHCNGYGRATAWLITETAYSCSAGLGYPKVPHRSKKSFRQYGHEAADKFNSACPCRSSGGLRERSEPQHRVLIQRRMLEFLHQGQTGTKF